MWWMPDWVGVFKSKWNMCIFIIIMCVRYFLIKAIDSSNKLNWPAYKRLIKLLINFKMVCTNCIRFNGIRSICLARCSKIICSVVDPTMGCYRTNYLHVSSSCAQARYRADEVQKRWHTKPHSIRIMFHIDSHLLETHQLMLNGLANVVHIWIIAGIVLIAIGWSIRGRRSNCCLIPRTWVEAHGCGRNRTCIDCRWRPKGIATTSAVREFRYRLSKHGLLNENKQTIWKRHFAYTGRWIGGKETVGSGKFPLIRWFSLNWRHCCRGWNWWRARILKNSIRVSIFPINREFRIRTWFRRSGLS